jgi:hypothetical protein
MTISSSLCQRELAFLLRMRIGAWPKSFPNHAMRLQRHGEAPLY